MNMHLSRIRTGTLGVLFLLASSVALCAADAPLDLSLWDTGMKPQKLSQYRGKIVVLNFWATWCENCKAELPMLVEEAKRYSHHDVVVIGASLDDATTVKKVRPFTKQERLDFPVWIGATVDTLQEFGLGNTIPATAVLDRDGHIAERVLGKLRQRDLEERLKWLLGNRQGPAPEPLVSNFNPD